MLFNRSVTFADPQLEAFVKRVGIKFGPWSETKKLIREGSQEIIDDMVRQGAPLFLAKMKAAEEVAKADIGANGMTHNPTMKIFIRGDRVETPNQKRVLFHEMTHWAGKKMEHTGDRTTRTENALEELVAEFGSIFLGRSLGYLGQKAIWPDSRDYVNEWLTGLIDNTGLEYTGKAIFLSWAKNQARERADWLIKKGGGGLV